MADNQLELREATKNLRLATEELQRFNQSAGYEIAKIVGKDVGGIASKFTAGFMQVPGVQHQVFHKDALDVIRAERCPQH